MVECFLAKEDVAGSTPVSRSNHHPACGTLSPITGCASKRRPIEARYPSGKGEVCKTFMRRFDPDPRLQIFQQLSNDSNQELLPLVFNMASDDGKAVILSPY